MKRAVIYIRVSTSKQDTANQRRELRLSQLIDAQNLIALMDDKTFVLWVKAVAAGGGSRSKESTFSSDLTYSGGAIASFALYDRAGELLEADTVSMYSGFVRIRNLPEGQLQKFND